MVDEVQVMFCDYCIAAGGQSDKNVFVKGCTNLKLELIKYHETSNSHLFAMNKYKNSQQPTETPAYKTKLSLDKAVYAKLSILFKTTHALNIKGRLARDYIWMNELHKSSGLDVGENYNTNVNNCVEFASGIADVQCGEIQDCLSKSKFVLVIVDGSMDSSIKHVKVG